MLRDRPLEILAPALNVHELVFPRRWVDHTYAASHIGHARHATRTGRQPRADGPSHSASSNPRGCIWKAARSAATRRSKSPSARSWRLSTSRGIDKFLDFLDHGRILGIGPGEPVSSARHAKCRHHNSDCCRQFQTHSHTLHKSTSERGGGTRSRYGRTGKGYHHVEQTRRHGTHRTGCQANANNSHRGHTSSRQSIQKTLSSLAEPAGNGAQRPAQPGRGVSLGDAL